MNNWKTVTIEEITEKVAMGPFGSSIKVSTFVDDGIPIISGAHLNKSRLEENTYNFITEEHAKKLKNANVFRGDIVFTHAGSIGQVSLIPNNSKYERYVISQRQFYLRSNKEKVLPEYLIYYFRSSKGQHQLLANASSTGVPSITQPVSYLTKPQILLPPIEEQKAIAKILSSLDDKIELNRQMNATLEAMARAVFKAWFVDFEPVRANSENRPSESASPEIAKLFPSEFENDIPKGWQEMSLDEIANFLNGLALQKYPPESEEEFLPVIKIAQLRKGNTEGSDKASKNLNPEYVVKDGDVLFSWSGSLEVEIWCGGDGALNQHLFKVTSEKYPKWFYFLWTRYHLPEFREIAAHKATTMGHIQRKHLTDAKVLVPNPETLRQMNKVFDPIISKLITNSLETTQLAEIRDSLLPRLISGKIRVGEAESLSVSF